MPLSFMASIFGMNAAEFQDNSSGNSTSNGTVSFDDAGIARGGGVTKWSTFVSDTVSQVPSIRWELIVMCKCYIPLSRRPGPG